MTKRRLALSIVLGVCVLFLVGTTTVACEACAGAGDVAEKPRPRPRTRDCPPSSGNKKKTKRSRHGDVTAVLQCGGQGVKVSGNGSGFAKNTRLYFEYRLRGPGGWSSENGDLVRTNFVGSFSARDYQIDRVPNGRYDVGVRVRKSQRGRILAVDSRETECP